ncbi:MAG TPA: PDZ domain-containing protein [Pseudidiomarina sp.]|nr:PDZ domain-containing protein [Pseudidiomarina sp.]
MKSFSSISLGLFAALTFSGSLFYGSPLAAELQENRAREMARAAAVEAAKAGGKNDSVVLEEPARSYFEWGAIVRPDGEVLSVRPGTVAADMGVQVGDELTHINHVSVIDESLQNILQMFDELEHGSTFSVTVLRDGDSQTLESIVRATVVPGWRLEVDSTFEETAVAIQNASACGRVSIFMQPPSTRDYYPAFINTINGDDMRIQNPIIKLGVGEHVIGLHEKISDPSVRRSRSLQPEKLMRLVVEPNKKYHLAAHFITEKRNDIINAGYWEPIVWKVTEHSCDPND